MPEPMIAPIRSALASVISRPESSRAMNEAASP